MLRGIHKASSTWLGKAIMAVVMGGLVDQLRDLGHRRHFPRLRAQFGRQDRRHRNLDRTVPPVLQRRLQQISRQLGRPITPDQARALGLDRQIARPNGRRNHARRAGQDLRLGICRRRDRPPHHQRSDFPRPQRPVRPRPLRADHPRCRLYRRPLRRRAAPRACCAGRSRKASAANCACRRRRWRRSINIQNEKRSIDYRDTRARRRPATFRRRRPKRSPNISTSARSCSARRNIARSRCSRCRPPSSPSRTRSPMPTPRAYYEQHKASYGTPERRELHQIVFPNAEEAAAARDASPRARALPISPRSAA